MTLKALAKAPSRAGGVAKKTPPRRASDRYVTDKGEPAVEEAAAAVLPPDEEEGGGAGTHMQDNSLADLRREFGRAEPTHGPKVVSATRKELAEDVGALRANSFDGLSKLTDKERGRGTSMDAIIEKLGAAAARSSKMDAAFSDSGRAGGLGGCFGGLGWGGGCIGGGRRGGGGCPDGGGGAASPPEGTQSALVFLKPHCAGSKACLALVRQVLATSKVEVVSEGAVKASDIKRHGLVDAHYAALANKAVRQDPRTLVVPPEGQAAFQATFGLGWAAALDAGLVYNASTAAFKLGLNDKALEKQWRALPPASVLKLGGGFYVGRLSDGGPFVVNGFYLALRSAFVAPGATVRWLVVRWAASDLTWADFRAKVVGGTDPSTASPGSVRRLLFDRWRALGLAAPPAMGTNGVHASASPLEALFERCNWLRLPSYVVDPFGAELILGGSGLDQETLERWASDPAVTFEGAPQSVFGLHEGLDAAKCLKRAADVHASEQRAAALQTRWIAYRATLEGNSAHG
jgi:hypothetical protein